LEKIIWRRLEKRGFQSKKRGIEKVGLRKKEYRVSARESKKEGRFGVKKKEVFRGV
jgi:hypothetical protein